MFMMIVMMIVIHNFADEIKMTSHMIHDLFMMIVMMILLVTRSSHNFADEIEMTSHMIQDLFMTIVMMILLVTRSSHKFADEIEMMSWKSAVLARLAQYSISEGGDPANYASLPL